MDKLLERKEELLARRRELLARGEEDSLAMALVKEELLEVNTRLRARRPSVRVGQQRLIYSQRAADRQQAADWDQGLTERDDNADERAKMLQAIHNNLSAVTPRQQEIFAMWMSGMRRVDIADKLGVTRTTVSKILKNARNHIRQAAEAQMRLDRKNRLDMTDPETAEALLSVVTPRQGECLRLYYGEGLQMKQIAEMYGVDKSTVSRTVTRAVKRVRRVVPGLELTPPDRKRGRKCKHGE